MRNGSKLAFMVLALPLTVLAQPDRGRDSGYVHDSGYGRLSYTLGEVRAVARDPDGADGADGVSLGGSALITPDLFIAGALTSVGSGGPNGYDDDTVEVGLGLRHAFTSQVDLVGIAGFIHDDRQVGNRDLGSDLGPSLTGGVRAELTPAIEVGGYIDYTRLYNDSNLGVRGEGLYHFTPNFSVLAGVGLTDSERTADLGARWYFNPGH